MRFPGIDHPRPNNGIVEGYIGDLKTDIKNNHLTLGKFGTVRVGRYIDFQKSRMESHLKELTVGYAQVRDKQKSKKSLKENEVTHSQVHELQENWGGKSRPKRNRTKFFNNSALKEKVDQNEM